APPPTPAPDAAPPVPAHSAPAPAAPRRAHIRPPPARPRAPGTTKAAAPIRRAQRQGQGWPGVQGTTECVDSFILLESDRREPGRLHPSGPDQRLRARDRRHPTPLLRKAQPHLRLRRVVLLQPRLPARSNTGPADPALHVTTGDVATAIYLRQVDHCRIDRAR